MPWSFSSWATAMQEWGMLTWLVASSIWMTSEFIWDDGKPIGILSALANHNGELAPNRFSTCLLVANVLMLSLWVYFVIGITAAWWPKLGAKWQDLTETSRIEAHTSLWFTLWLLMESMWIHIDLLQLRETCAQRWAIAALFIGIGATFGCAICARKSYIAGKHIEAWHFSAELCWVLGNMLWMILDAFSSSAGNQGLSILPAIVFALGVVAAARCIASSDNNDEKVPVAPVCQHKYVA